DATPAGTLTVALSGAVPTGITIAQLTNTNGTISALVGASCGATLGSNVISLKVTDGAGLVGTGSFTVTVVDTTAPTISCPGDQLVEATGPNGASVTFTPTASDLCGATASCTPSSGSTFPRTATGVTCTATDNNGLHSSCQFMVTV